MLRFLTMTSQPMEFQLTAPEPLVIDLVRWVAARSRTYRETMDAWRTSCPRLPVWEDALESGFLEVARAEGGDELTVAVTPAGLEFLERRRV
jgi:hypothetical protein